MFDNLCLRTTTSMQRAFFLLLYGSIIALLKLCVVTIQLLQTFLLLFPLKSIVFPFINSAMLLFFCNNQELSPHGLTVQTLKIY